jgi:hypothetical protein
MCSQDQATVSSDAVDERLLLEARAIREASAPVIRRSQHLCEQSRRLITNLAQVVSASRDNAVLRDFRRDM